MFFYLLNHIRTYTNKRYSFERNVGCFTSIDKALEARTYLLKKFGFRDYPNGFSIQLFEVPEYREGDSLFSVTVIEPYEDDLSERAYYFGLVTDLKEAQLMKRRLRRIGHPNENIIVGKKEINRIGWSEGFGFD